MSRDTTQATGSEAVSAETTSPEDDLLSQFFSLEENLNACMTVSLKELEDRFTPYPALRPVWQPLKAFLRKRGKRVRPMLFLLSYRLFDQDSEIPPMAAFRAAAALEIFHAFALVHDDIIDASHSRRGEPTLHIRLASDAQVSSKNGENLALVLGDILFGFAMERFLDPGFDSGRASRAMRFFLKVAQDTGLGQAVEIAHLEESLGSVSEEEILRTYFLKTTRYTVESPLILGAILAGANHNTEKTLCNFANPLGLAFQIENDLHEVSQLAAGDSDLAYDLHAGVKTLFLKKLHTRLDAKGKAEMELLLREGAALELAAMVKSPVAAEVSNALRNEVSDYFKEARAVLRRSNLSKTQREGLLGFAEFISMNSHHSEAEESRFEASA
ncbi:polyprenyl synthetase family protein [Rubellicoccus peritrichatus]|uniref:Polyprenyl synthetase family protein n=1 Tax=Rubellicoccus peritrichatus TaxID=3080537 RepID=A0AAQ3LDS6_9BACT|nr:polyprenyl synthetase family protein [Puniceicoccus sp. CR14]WOO42055.1 polyprenyl synthetase family protein [Puniceicoccus sp. CR14]